MLAHHPPPCSLRRLACRVSDLRLPFECPSDFVLHIPYMEMAGLEGRYRVPGFLEDPRVGGVCACVCLWEVQRGAGC